MVLLALTDVLSFDLWVHYWIWLIHYLSLIKAFPLHTKLFSLLYMPLTDVNNVWNDFQGRSFSKSNTNCVVFIISFDKLIFRKISVTKAKYLGLFSFSIIMSKVFKRQACGNMIAIPWAVIYIWRLMVIIVNYLISKIFNDKLNALPRILLILLQKQQLHPMGPIKMILNPEFFR